MTCVRHFAPNVVDNVLTVRVHKRASAKDAGFRALNASWKRQSFLRTLLTEAGTISLGNETFAQLFDDIIADRSVRTIASRDRVSAATAFRKQREHLRRMRFGIVAVQMYRGIKRGTGVTVDLNTGFPLERMPVYLVSVAEHGRSFGSLPHAQLIFDWLMAKASVFDRSVTELYPGAWISSQTGSYWCDLNYAFRQKDEAIAFAIAQGQESIRDHWRRRDILIEKRAAA
jgi:hypothetical protein